MPDKAGAGDGWEQWSKHVLLQLESIDDTLGAVQKEIVQMKIEIAMLKIKSSLWGALAGLGSAGGLLIWEMIKRRVG